MIEKGEGKLEEYNPKIKKWSTKPSSKIADEGGGQVFQDKSIQKNLQYLQTMVEVLV